jgi:choice-of-anchor B domain-containing protein
MFNQILLSIALALGTSVYAQTNLSLVAHYPYAPGRGDCSDIWGYVDETGIEYAIVGNQNGTSIVSLADPSNPVEVLYSPGAVTIWRDMKVWGDYAYITNEGGNGLKIIDLTNLPGPLNAGDVSQYTGSTYPFTTAHNIYIDEFGKAYICGANNGVGGAIILDLTVDPLNPVELGRYNEFYMHDVYVRNDTLYGGAINDGFLVVADVSDPTNVVTLATQFTPGVFTHQVWLSDDGDYLFTNDEVSGGHVAAFDVSDVNNVFEVDRIQSSPGQNVIPHNTFVKGNFLFTSFYRDGVVMHDASNPSSLIEVGNFDTSPAFSGDGFNGCWGVYPYFPSGLIIASDIEEGLYVLNPTYVQGSFVSGTVTDNVTTDPIYDALVEILASPASDNTDPSGEYLTGVANAGTYDIAFSKLGYFPDTVYNVVLTSGVTTIVDIALQPMITFNLDGIVQDSQGNPIENAQVLIFDNQFTTTVTTNGLGEFTVSSFLENDYNVTIGLWGYHTLCLSNQYLSSTGGPYVFTLESGYSDFFDLNLGWVVSGNAATGDWERGVPVGTSFDGGPANPGNDSGDCGTMAYVTGNAGGQAGNDDVDDGTTILTSPIFDLSTYNNPYLSFDRWFFNDGGTGTPNDSLVITLSNGTQTVVLDFAIHNTAQNAQWVAKEYKLLDYISLTEFMQLKVRAMDLSPGHLAEGGFDNFMVVDSSELGIDNVIVTKIIPVYPNPFNDKLTVDLSELSSEELALEFIEIGSGKIAHSQKVNAELIELIVPLQKGMYLLRILDGETQLTQERVVKF